MLGGSLLVVIFEGEGDAPDRDGGAVLPHPDDRAVALIGNIEVGPGVQSRIARPVDIVVVSLNRRQVDRAVQRLRAYPGDRSQTEDLVGGAAGNR